MKKRLTSVCAAFAGIALAAGVLCTASCERYILPRLDSDTDTIWAPLSGGVFDVVFTSNVKWMIDVGSIADWITIAPRGGESDYEEMTYLLKVDVAANSAGEARKCNITYTSLTLARTLVVEQEGPEGFLDPRTEEQ